MITKKSLANRILDAIEADLREAGDLPNCIKRVISHLRLRLANGDSTRSVAERKILVRDAREYRASLKSPSDLSYALLIYLCCVIDPKKSDPIDIGAEYTAERILALLDEIYPSGHLPQLRAKTNYRVFYEVYKELVRA